MELYRTIDANINRLREGLRVIEDILRYQYNAAGLLPRVKELRHSIASVDKTTFRGRISYRDSMNDDGYDNIGANENVRSCAEDLLRANFLRCQEASRVLEELFKVKQYEKGLYQEVKKIRYSLYELEKDVFLHFGDTDNRDVYLNLCMVADVEMCKTNILKNVEKAIAGGITSVVLEQSGLSDREFVDLGLKIKRICAIDNLPLIINKRTDICLAVKANGVHLDIDDISPETARQILGKDKIIGYSVNSLETIKSVQDSPVDYLRFSPLFEGKNSTEETENRLDFILELHDAGSLPLVFYGGIDKSNIAKVRKAGGYNVAIKNELMLTESPEKIAKILRKQI